MVERSLVGLDLGFTNDLVSQYTEALSSGYAFISIDLFHPKAYLNSGDTTDVSGAPGTRSDLVFQKDGKSIVKSIVGNISAHIDVDSPIDDIRVRSEAALTKELEWAAYLGLPAINIYITRPENPNLARILINFIRSEYLSLKLWLFFPMTIEKNPVSSTCVETADTGNSVAPDAEEDVSLSPWHWWQHLSLLATDVTEYMGIVLDIPLDLPDEAVITRWLSEPISCISLQTSLFLTNSKGYPVLPKSHQELLRRFFKLPIQILIRGANLHDYGLISYQQYITWLWKNRGTLDLYDQQSKGLNDLLQEPLQPLRDNLSSTVYSIFEMDPYKYKAYETAIYQALLSRMSGCGTRQTMLNGDFSANGSMTPNCQGRIALSNASPFCQVIAVLGAGRGPLVNATLRAAEKANCTVRVYVVEKNTNALFTLQDRMSHEWFGLDVHLIPGDMRNLSLPEKADIFVSELLGSFGDNELSPECLDGAQPFLKDDGLSIPCSYTSYIVPFQSLQFFNETKRYRDSATITLPHEMPYVVRLLNCKLLDSPRTVFSFHHPKLNLAESNARSTTCHFTMKQDAVIHGLAGYFEATLFEDIKLSIHPERHSPQMVSWFPLAFPFDRPVPVKATEVVSVRLWRVVTSRHIWYEWALSAPRPTRIHNSSGQGYKIAL